MKKTHSYANDGPPEFQWPRFRWRVELWLSVASLLLAVLLLVLPNLPNEPGLRPWRNILGAIFVCAPFVISPILWMIKSGFALVKRGLSYGYLYQVWRDEHEECQLFQQNILLFIEQMFANREFEISKAYVYQGKVYIDIKKEDTTNVAVGGRFMVVQKGDYQVIGLFEVTEVRRANYYAIAVGRIDPVWKGFIYERKEVSFFPNTSAIYLSQGVQR